MRSDPYRKRDHRYQINRFTMICYISAGEWDQVLLSEERSSPLGDGFDQLDYVQVAAKRFHTLEHARLSTLHCS